MRNYFLKVLYFLYIFIVLSLSLLPLGNNSITQHDKVNHFIAFFIFTVLGFLAYRFGYIYLFISGLILGIFIEISQSLVRYRSTELADILADTAGILAALFIIFLIKKFIFLGENIYTIYNINLNKKFKEESNFE